MASKKDFAGMNTGRVYGAIEQATEIMEKAQAFLDTVNSGAFSFLLDESNDEKTGDAKNDE